MPDATPTRWLVRSLDANGTELFKKFLVRTLARHYALRLYLAGLRVETVQQVFNGKCWVHHGQEQ